MSKITKSQKKILDDLKLKLAEKGASKAELKDLNGKFDVLVKALKENLTTQIITKVTPFVEVKNLEKEITRLAETVAAKQLEAHHTKPDWYEAPPKELSVKVDNNNDGVIGFLTGAFSELVRFLGKLATGTFKVQQDPSDFLKPQLVVLYDVINQRAVNLEKLFNITSIVQPPSVSVSGGGASAISLLGAKGLGSDTLTITTAGTRVQLPNIPCSSVTIQSHEDNGNLTNNGTIVAGGSNVVAASVGRKGYAIYPTQAQTFQVANANMVWIDSTDNGAKITYTYAN